MKKKIFILFFFLEFGFEIKKFMEYIFYLFLLNWIELNWI